MRTECTSKCLANLPLVLILFLCGLLSSCLYTGNRFQTGKLLPAGDASFAIGMSRLPIIEVNCPSNSYSVGNSENDKTICLESNYLTVIDSSSGQYQYNTIYDTVSSQIKQSSLFKPSIQWALGLRDQWGPFTGVQIGFAIEVPTAPASLEFDFQLGLPKPRNLSLEHSIGVGWGIGAWADNTWFVEYNASLWKKSFGLYGGARLLRSATLPAEQIDFGEEPILITNPRWVQQAHLGLSIPLGQLPVLPDRLLPEFGFVYPNYRVNFNDLSLVRISGIYTDFRIAMAWEFK